MLFHQWSQSQSDYTVVLNLYCSIVMQKLKITNTVYIKHIKNSITQRVTVHNHQLLPQCVAHVEGSHELQAPVEEMNYCCSLLHSAKGDDSVTAVGFCQTNSKCSAVTEARLCAHMEVEMWMQAKEENQLTVYVTTLKINEKC